MGMPMPVPTDTRRSVKSETAFRTISEVSEELNVPQHVLRFWETKFAQIRPMKRGGGRRYYRPEDVALLQRIRSLLYSDGFTIKGVQKLLRDGTSGDTAVIAEEMRAQGAMSAAPMTAEDMERESESSFDDLDAEFEDEDAALDTPPDLFAGLASKAASGGLTLEQRGVIGEVLEELTAVRDLLAAA